MSHREFYGEYGHVKEGHRVLWDATIAPSKNRCIGSMSFRST